MKLNAEIQFESVTEDDRNFGIVFKQKDSKGSSKIPKKIHVRVPLFYGDDATWEVPFRVRFNQPNEATPRVSFSLEPIGFDLIWRNAVKTKIAELREALTGYRFFAGSADTENISRKLLPVGH